MMKTIAQSGLEQEKNFGTPQRFHDLVRGNFSSATVVCP